MALPQAVAAQIEQAEALQAQLYPTEPATPPEDVQTAAEKPPVEAPPSNVVELPKVAEPAPPVEAPKAPEQSSDAAYWKQKFDTLQGKFNAEVPTLYQQLKDQQAQMNALIQQMQERKTETAPKQEALVTDKDVEDYGPDLIDMTRRVAAETVKRAIAEAIGDFRREVGAVQAQVGQVTEQVVQSESDKFWGRVMSIVPDWKTVDADPRWVEWLNTAPKFSKRTYRQLAAEAISLGDAEAVAELVNAWRGPQQAPVIPTPTPTPTRQQNPELQRQVTPSNSKSSAPAQPAEKLWTRAEYEAAMDVRNVNRLGKAEADRLEAEANRAVAEGRVQW